MSRDDRGVRSRSQDLSPEDGTAPECPILRLALRRPIYHVDRRVHSAAGQRDESCVCSTAWRTNETLTASMLRWGVLRAGGGARGGDVGRAA